MNLAFSIIKWVLALFFVGLGGLLLLGSFSPQGFTARVVLSGSMEPAIPTGAIVFTLPRESYEVGDVITFKTDQRTDVPTTHRITEIKKDSLGEIYTTRGDANDVDDFVSIRPNQVLGQVLFHVPYIGYILDFAKKPIGFVLLIGFPALLIVIEEAKKIVAEVRRSRRRGEENEEETDSAKI